MISLCEAVLANSTGVQPPNPTTPVNQQQATSVPTQNQNTPVENNPNPAAGQQQSDPNVQQPNNGQSSFDWKKILKPLAIGGAAIGAVGLGHALYNGNSLNPLNYLPKLGSGANFVGAGEDSGTTPTESPTDSGENNVDIPRKTGVAPANTNHSDIVATPGSTMVGPPPHEHIPQRVNVYREARPMFRVPRTGLMFNSGTGDYYNFRYHPRPRLFGFGW